jgi:hypothetical protein
VDTSKLAQSLFGHKDIVTCLELSADGAPFSLLFSCLHLCAL